MSYTDAIARPQKFNRQQQLILLATVVASSLGTLFGISVTVGLPSIQTHFGSSLASLQWISSAYVLVVAVLTLIGGSLGDQYGRKRLFLAGIALFGLGGLVSAFASSVSILIILQVLQGLGAAFMIPGSLAVINYCFGAAQRGRAIGLWLGYTMGLSLLAPFIAGWLIEVFGWRGIFAMNAPIALLALFIAHRFIPNDTRKQRTHLDWSGTLVVALSLSGIAYALIQAPLTGWLSPLTLGALIIGLGGLVYFVRLERTAKNPILPLTIFKSSLVAGANLTTLFIYFVLSSMIFVITLNFQQVQGYSPLQAGLALIPAMIPMVLLSGWSGSLADRYGPRRQMVGGPLLVALAMALLWRTGPNANYVIDFLPALIIQGFGMAALVAPLTKSAMAVPEHYSGAASGVNNAASRLASLLSVAMLGVIMLPIFSSELGTLLAHDTVLSTELKGSIVEQQAKLGGIELPTNLSAEARAVGTAIIDTAFITAFRVMVGVNLGLALISALVAYFSLPAGKKKHR